MIRQRIIIFLLTLSGIYGCNGLRSVFSDRSPYDQYLASLEKAALGNTSLAREWIAAGQRVLTDSVIVSLPFSEAGFFSAQVPEARSYQFEGKAGQVLSVQGITQSSSGGRLFMDLFFWRKGEWEEIAYGDSALSLTHEFDRDSRCLLRLQPELLTDVYYSVTFSFSPSLINPVFGATNRSIQSFYGDPRDGGQRRHEGVDIFASRGTPVIAPANGLVLRVGSNNLGGKVVWMQDLGRGQTYYFAHLDTQLVGMGKALKQGDTLGLVGNSGNARYTPPHLHFGIYKAGSKDPLHYIRQPEVMAEIMEVDTSLDREAFKVIPGILNLRASADITSPIIDQLEKDTYVKVIGRSGSWYRIKLPDQRQGFLADHLIRPLDTGLPVRLDTASVLFSAPFNHAIPKKLLSDSIEVFSLARYRDYQYVRTREGLTGWLKI